MLPANQEERLALVQALAPIVAPLSLSWEQSASVDLEELDVLLDKIRFKLQRPHTSWDPTKRPAEEALLAARQALLALQERLRTTPPGDDRAVLETWQRAFMADFADKLGLLQRNVHPAGPITLADVPSYLRERYVGQSGQFLLRVYARHNIWEREPMQDFVTQVQAIDADVTGAPVVAFYAIREMQRGYVRGGLYALAIIVGLTWLDFRRLKPTVFALLPLGLGALWIVPWMVVLDVPWNMANLVVLPLFMGIAVDCGVHLVHRALETPETAASPLASSTGKAVFASGLTTMVGFGSLLVAQHAGIFSLGLLLTLAIGCNLAAGFIVLPLVFHLWRCDALRGQHPVGPKSAAVIWGPRRREREHGLAENARFTIPGRCNTGKRLVSRPPSPNPSASPIPYRRWRVTTNASSVNHKPCYCCNRSCRCSVRVKSRDFSKSTCWL